MSNVIINRIRPVSWKIYVQGKDGAQYVRGRLAEAQIESSEAIQERDLAEPPIYSFTATPKIDTPLTAQELQAMLENDPRIEVAFDATEGKT